MSWYIPVPKDNVNVVSGWGEYQLQGNGVPNDATGKLGDTYLNVANNRLYLKRWVGQFNGLDRVNGLPLGASGQRAPLRIDAVVYKATSPFVGNMLSNGTSPTGVRLAQDDVSIFFANDGTTIQVSQTTTGRWAKFSGIVDGTNQLLLLDNVVVGTLANTALCDLFGAGWVRAGDRVGSETPSHRIVSSTVTRLDTGVKLLDWQFDAGIGATVRDASNSKNNGTLTDGTPTNFWYQAWVPMDLL